MRKLTTLLRYRRNLNSATALAEKWDMPMAYAATNFHSEMGVVFADKVRDYTKGEIDITVHPGGSLFKGGEIKRAVQTGQAPIGERFMSAHANEAPLLGWIISHSLRLPTKRTKSCGRLQKTKSTHS